ncbi:MAG: hypothetical protein KGZ83_14195 [Sulfuricella sp.]|nr:hypothetical protein [Sulfuricella sp.]
MKWAKVLMLTSFLAVTCTSGTASARDHHDGYSRGHVHGSVGIYLGPGPAWPWYAYPPRYYYPPYPPYQPMVVVPPTPPVYIERTDIPPALTVQPPPAIQAPAPAPVPPAVQAPAPAPESYWYYCTDPQGYYPYVKSCPLGWQKVAPAVPQQ